MQQYVFQTNTRYLEIAYFLKKLNFNFLIWNAWILATNTHTPFDKSLLQTQYFKTSLLSIMIRSSKQVVISKS